jgi:omega-6 fatty acid desaturase (delta-12 desaturase)
MAGSLGWAAVTYIPTIPDSTVRAIAWVVYGFVQGLICTGLWIIGHEAGHGSFSKHARLNDVVGFLSHSALSVPYFSWKFSHHRHHMYTGHMEKDMVFVPKTQAQHQNKSFFQIEFLEDTPAYQLLTLVLHQVFGWPFYLFLNISAGSNSLQKQSSSLLSRSHFDPRSAVFRRSEAPFILLSDIGICITMFAVYKLSTVVGVSTALLAYVQPWFWVHHWLSKS